MDRDDEIDEDFSMPRESPYIVEIAEDRTVPLEEMVRRTGSTVTEHSPVGLPGGNGPIDQVIAAYGKTDLMGDVQPKPMHSPDPEEKVKPSQNKSVKRKKGAKKKGDTGIKKQKQKKKKNPFISFFVSMYSRRPNKRAADVARQAGRQWYRMSDQQKSRYTVESPEIGPGPKQNQRKFD